MKAEDEIFNHIQDVFAEAAKKALDNIGTRPDGVPVAGFAPDDDPAPEGTLRMRMDLDIAGHPDDDGMDLLLLSRIPFQAAEDLTEMLRDGDRDLLFDHPTHSLLGMVDGVKKTGRGLEYLEVKALMVFRQHVWRKGSTEYTIYFNVLPHWEQ